MESSSPFSSPSTRIERIRSTAFAWAAAIVFAGAAGASLECPNDGNLIENCGFEVDDTSLWEPFGGVLATSTSFAHTGDASGVIGAEEFQPGQFGNGIETCLETVAPSTQYEFGAWALFTTTGSKTIVNCIVSVSEYEEAACEGFSFNESNGGGSAGPETFQEVRGQEGFTTSAKAVSIGVGLGCGLGEADSDFELYIDDFFLIPALTIFVEGFDSGTTCAWSDSVGGGCV